MLSIIAISVLAGFIVGALFTGSAAYLNGAVDAYYFAREPKHPGGRRAGRIIHKSLQHMYGDIPDPDSNKPEEELDLYEVAMGVGAEFEGGEEPDESIGYPGYPSTISFTEPQLADFAKKVLAHRQWSR